MDLTANPALRSEIAENSDVSPFPPPCCRMDFAFHGKTARARCAQEFASQAPDNFTLKINVLELELHAFSWRDRYRLLALAYLLMCFARRVQLADASPFYIGSIRAGLWWLGLAHRIGLLSKKKVCHHSAPQDTAQPSTQVRHDIAKNIVISAKFLENSGLSHNHAMFKTAIGQVEIAQDTRLHLHLEPPLQWECANHLKIKETSLQIGFPLFEFPSLNPTEIRAINSVDALLAPSKFVAQTVRRELRFDKRCYYIGKSIQLPDDLPNCPPILGLSENDPYMVIAFDAHSGVTRKNPLVALQAFLASAPANMHIVIKSTPLGNNHWGDSGDQLTKIADIATRHPRVHFIAETWRFHDLLALIKGAKGLISAHRAEGFGYFPAYALYYGVPVITTDYGGTTDFCNSGTAACIPFQMETVDPADFMPLQEVGTWAKIDELALSRAIWRLCQSRDNRADGGQRLVRSLYSPIAFSSRLQEALRSIVAHHKQTEAQRLTG